MRGLKLCGTATDSEEALSHPERVRGLKPTPSVDDKEIESRTPSGCVD